MAMDRLLVLSKLCKGWDINCEIYSSGKSEPIYFADSIFRTLCFVSTTIILQVLLNYRRKSTKGWQIWNIILDFSGGTLSVVQLIGDSFAAAPNSSWTTGIVGNPAKIGLGLVSIFFDVRYA